ncbi:MAG: hypothetical protein LBK59_04575, partial [Bifidobacteriaceae bacterium]|nr:hypothetical protein [Bifidobacteriaceae bacterium]
MSAFTRTRHLVAAAVGLAVAMVCGCAGPPPEIHPDPVPAEPPPAVAEVQTGRILDQLGHELEATQETGSLDGLTRVGAVAAQMLAAQTAMRATDPDNAPADQLATQFAGIVVPAAATWPRTFAAVTVPTESGAQYLYAVTQPDPRSPYAMT